MTEQPKQSQFSLGAAPPAPSGKSRLGMLLRTAATGGLMVAGGLYILQLCAPYDLKPSVVMGKAAGTEEAAKTEAMRAIVIDYERQLADAKAQAQAKAQEDVIAVQKVLDERTESLRLNSAMGSIADAACIGARIVSSLTMPQGLGRGPNDDIYSASQSVGAATCGQGDVIRNDVTRSQIEAIRTVTGERGVSMDNGAVAVTQAANSEQGSDLDRRALRAIDAVTTASHRYEGKYHDYTEQWAAKLHPTLREHLYANLPNKDVLVERAMAMSAVYSPETANKIIPYIDEPTTPTAPAVIEAKLTQANVQTKWTPLQQGQLRMYSYRMPPAVLQKINAGLDARHGYPNVWYDRVAQYQATHRG